MLTFEIFWAVCRSLFILCSVYIMNLDGYSYFSLSSQCFFVSFFFFHALLSWPFLGKVAVTCPKQLSFIKLSLILFYTWLYNRPVLHSLSFASLCYCCFCKYPLKSFFILNFLISKRVLGVALSQNVFANYYW